VPRIAAGLQQLLLAYDGSPKANEALFVARYMVEQWHSALLVVTAGEGGRTGEALANRARGYLNEHGVKADYLIMQGEPGTVILQAAGENESDLILMGGYGSSPLAGIVAGSVVDAVLRSRNRPVLICR
jgi:nucleotide-binding universal stress UspA family protein